MVYRHDKSPRVLDLPSIAVSLALHAAFFAACWFAAMPMKEKKVVIPIDLTVIMQENLDGNDEEPPPVEPPKPEPPKPEPPKPEPPKPEPPKPEPVKPPDAIVKEPPKTNEVAKVEEKKPEPPKPEPPKETRADRLKRIRDSLKDVKTAEPAKPQPNGRTDRKTLSDADIAKALAAGARPGRTESLAADEASRCVSLIYRAFYDRWVSPPYSPSLSTMVLEVRFDPGGRVLSTRLAKSSGDAAADKSVRDVAALVKYVAGLTPAFLRENPVVTVSFEVKPQ